MGIGCKCKRPIARSVLGTVVNGNREQLQRPGLDRQQIYTCPTIIRYFHTCIASIRCWSIARHSWYTYRDILICASWICRDRGGIRGQAVRARYVRDRAILRAINDLAARERVPGLRPFGLLLFLLLLLLAVRVLRVLDCSPSM